MQLRIRYFASLREALGSGETLSVDGPLTMGQLRDRLIAASPAHAAALSRERAVRCALDQVMSDESEPLQDGSEVAFFPPVTGG